MKSRSVLATLIAVAFVLGACGQDEPTGKQRATEASADQPLSPSPLPTETTPETPEQTAQDVAAAREQADDTRSQVRLAAKVADAEKLEQEIGTAARDLDLLVETVSNLKIQDATETTRVIEDVAAIQFEL